MFDNPRAWTTVCDCIDIASRAIRSIVDPSYNLGLAMGPNIPPHASRRDVGYPSYPQNQMYNGNVYPTQNQYPSYPPPPQYGVYPAPYIPGKTDIRQTVVDSSISTRHSTRVRLPTLRM